MFEHSLKRSCLYQPIKTTIHTHHLDAIIRVLENERACCDDNTQVYTSYTEQPLLHDVDYNKVIEWVKEKMLNANMYMY